MSTSTFTLTYTNHDDPSVTVSVSVDGADRRQVNAAAQKRLPGGAWRLTEIAETTPTTMRLTEGTPAA